MRPDNIAFNIKRNYVLHLNRDKILQIIKFILWFYHQWSQHNIQWYYLNLVVIV